MAAAFGGEGLQRVCSRGALRVQGLGLRALAHAAVAQHDIAAGQAEAPRLELALGHVHAHAQHGRDQELRARAAHARLVVLQHVHLHVPDEKR